MSFTVDSNVINKVTVDGTDIKKITVDGTVVWRFADRVITFDSGTPQIRLTTDGTIEYTGSASLKDPQSGSRVVAVDSHFYGYANTGTVNGEYIEVVKYPSNDVNSGSEEWTLKLDDDGDDGEGSGMVADNSENLIVYKQGGNTWKISPSGNKVWVNSFNATPVASNIDELYLAYVGGDGTGDDPIYLEKYNPDGSLATSTSTTVDDKGTDAFLIAEYDVNRDGEFYVFAKLLTSGAPSYLIKFDSSLSEVWRINGDKFAYVSGLTADPDGNIVFFNSTATPETLYVHRKSDGALISSNQLDYAGLLLGFDRQGNLFFQRTESPTELISFTKTLSKNFGTETNGATATSENDGPTPGRIGRRSK